MKNRLNNRDIFLQIKARISHWRDSRSTTVRTEAKNEASFYECPPAGNSSGGFTLIEVLVSVSIFAIVMLVATGSVFSIVEANKKTHSLKSVMTNLNFALESMTRDMRVGFKYSCGVGGDCPTTPGTVFTFKANRDVDGDSLYSTSDANDQIEYSLVNVSGINRIQKRILGASVSTYYITSPEIQIESMKFYVIGTAAGDQKQPKAVVVIRGYAGTGETRSPFNIETTVSQRAIDS